VGGGGSEEVASDESMREGRAPSTLPGKDCQGGGGAGTVKGRATTGFGGNNCEEGGTA